MTCDSRFSVFLFTHRYSEFTHSFPFTWARTLHETLLNRNVQQNKLHKRLTCFFIPKDFGLPPAVYSAVLTELSHLQHSRKLWKILSWSWKKCSLVCTEIRSLCTIPPTLTSLQLLCMMLQDESQGHIWGKTGFPLQLYVGTFRCSHLQHSRIPMREHSKLIPACPK